MGLLRVTKVVLPGFGRYAIMVMAVTVNVRLNKGVYAT